jgi:ubiquinone/menaquinone biosynthesis C-methylase UbiE
MQEDIQNFWEMHPCGAELVGDFSEKTREAYEDFFARYDEFRYRTEPHILKNLDLVDFKGNRVLEIGLGQGADGEQIIRRGGVYTGADLTEESVKRTRMRFSLRGLAFDDVRQASALKLPFADNSFDIVYSYGVLHHIPDIKKAAGEIARVLKPDGRLIVMLYARRSLNYLFAISVARRAGLAALYAAGAKPKGIFGRHIEQARAQGLGKYLKMENFIHVNTDGPLNPYSKVYDLGLVKKDFPQFTIIDSHKHFMHAPPLPVKWLPLESLLGWHLWVEMTPGKDL